MRIYIYNILKRINKYHRICGKSRRVKQSRDRYAVVDFSYSFRKKSMFEFNENRTDIETHVHITRMMDFVYTIFKTHCYINLRYIIAGFVYRITRELMACSGVFRVWFNVRIITDIVLHIKRDFGHTRASCNFGEKIRKMQRKKTCFSLIAI